MDARQLWSSYGSQLLARAYPSFAPATERVAFGSVALAADVANRDVAAANENVLLFGNTVPAWSSAWSIHSDVATEYALFLDRVGAQQFAVAVADARARAGAALDATTATSFNMPMPRGVYAPAFALSGVEGVIARWRAAAAAGTREAIIRVQSDTSDTEPLAFAARRAAATSLAFDERTPLFDAGDLPAFFVRAVPVTSRRAAAVSESMTTISAGEISVTFTGLEAVPIGPARGWFDEQLLAACRSMALDPPPYFGAGGSFALLPTHVILGYGITVDLTVAEESFGAGALLRTTLQALQVGPFVVNAAAGILQIDTARSVIHMGGIGSDVPVMLAVICRIL